MPNRIKATREYQKNEASLEWGKNQIDRENKEHDSLKNKFRV